MNLALSKFSTSSSMLPTRALLNKSIKRLSLYLTTSVNSAYLNKFITASLINVSYYPYQKIEKI